MESLHKFESTVEGWLKPLPHLPTDWRKWLAVNAWWLTLIGVILSAIAILGLAWAVLVAMSIFGAVTTSFYGYVAPTVYSTWWVLASVVSLALLVLTTVLEAMAISPLRAMKARGWDLMFLVFVVGLVSGVAGAVLNFNALSFIPSLIGTAIGGAISAYFLFEVRSYFKKA